jgi:DNA-binding FadR family transcriptional regulator
MTEDGGRAEGQRLYREVADQVRALIAADGLKPGQRLPSERMLAERLHVARSTLREAMIALEIAGVVSIRTGSGIYVLPPEERLQTLADLGAGPLELLDARELIEGEIAFRAASMADSRQLLVIERTIVQMEKADAADGHRDADRAFHVALVETLRNEPMRQIVEQLWAEMTSPLFIRMGAMSGLFGTGDDHALQHHRRIFDALTRRDGPAAKAAMQAHLFEVRKILLHDPAIAELTLHTDSR